MVINIVIICLILTGSIPLRHLVYRVHRLPESMRSLVWDFGSLQPEVEERYIRQIVRRYVRKLNLQREAYLEYFCGLLGQVMKLDSTEKVPIM